MLKAGRRSKISLGLFVSLLAPVLVSATTLNYSEKVTTKQQQLLNGDLEKLRTLIPIDADGELKRLLKLNAVSSQDMDQWLSQRVRYIVEEGYQAEKSLFVVNSRRLTQQPQQNRSRLDDRKAPRVMMSNLGGTIYIAGKRKGVVYGALISGLQSIIIDSPRIGLLQVGEEFFRPIVQKWSEDKISNEAHSIWRLTTLFHEARHSDGNGDNTAFVHSMCPADHNLAGRYGCDATANGAYRIGSLVMRSLTANCVTCTQQEKDVLGMLAADHVNRILVPIKPTHSGNDLCRLAEASGKKPRFCERENFAAENEVDDTPEYAK